MDTEADGICRKRLQLSIFLLRQLQGLLVVVQEFLSD